MRQIRGILYTGAFRFEPGTIAIDRDRIVSVKTCSEEEYMESIQYDELEVQQFAHDVFITRLELMNLDDFDISRKQELTECVEALAEWVLTHILHADVLIGRTKEH